MICPPSPNNVQGTKTRMRWVGHMVHMGKGEVLAGLWWRNQRERDCLEELNMQGRIILKCFTR